MTAIHIYVDRNVVASNRKHGTFRPAVKVRRGQDAPLAGHHVECHGPVTFVQSDTPDPLAGGATVWAFTNHPVDVYIRRTDDGTLPKAGETWEDSTLIRVHPDHPEPETIRRGPSKGRREVRGVGFHR